jgi:hypothetical protein
MTEWEKDLHEYLLSFDDEDPEDVDPAEYARAAAEAGQMEIWQERIPF